MSNVSDIKALYDKTRGFLIKHCDTCVLFILLIAFVLRIAALISFKDSMYYRHLFPDETVYYLWASEIARGDYMTNNAYDFAPLPAYVFAFIYKVFSPDQKYIRYLNLALGVLTCFTLYLVGKELGGRIVGLTSSFIAALYKPFVFFSVVLQKTSLSLFLFGISTYLFMTLSNSGDSETVSIRSKKSYTNMIRALFFGICIGLLTNVRSNCLVIMALIPLIAIWSGIKKKLAPPLVTCAICVIGFIVAISPFIFRTYLTTGEFAVSPASGYNLYLSNNLNHPYPYYRPVPFATTKAGEQATQFVIEASRRTGKKMTPGEASSFWTRQVLMSAAEKPTAFLKKVCTKLLALYNRYESADNHHIGFTSNVVRFFKLPLMSFWFVLPLGMAGMALTALQSRKSLSLFLIFILYGATLVIFFANVRIRLPLLIILIPFAVNGIKHIVERLYNGQKRPIGIFMLVMIAFSVIENFPLPGTDDMSAHYLRHATSLNALGENEQAITFWKKTSSTNKSYSDAADISLAKIYFRRGRVEEAFDYIDKVSDNSYIAAIKHETIGDMMVDMKQKKRGVEAYEKSLRINYGARRVHKKLYELYKEVDKEKAKRQYKKYQYVSSFYGDT